MNTEKPTQKKNSPLQAKRLFGGEGWKPLGIDALRQLCKGVKEVNYWDRYDVPSNCFYSTSPIPIQETNGVDYSGVIRGTVTVIGFYGEISNRRYWVVNCKCGVFELISEKTLREKPNSPHHCYAVCRLEEAKRYQEECCDLAERNGLNFEEMRIAYKAGRGNHGKRNSFGLIHFIQQQIKRRK